MITSTDSNIISKYFDLVQQEIKELISKDKEIKPNEIERFNHEIFNQSDDIKIQIKEFIDGASMNNLNIKNIAKEIYDKFKVMVKNNVFNQDDINDVPNKLLGEKRLITKFNQYILEKNNAGVSINSIITKITRFMNKYKLKYFLIGNEIKIDRFSFYIACFEKSNEYDAKGEIYLDYEYSLDTGYSINGRKDPIDKLPSNLLSGVFDDIKKNNRMTPEYLLETTDGDINILKKVLRYTKEEIDFTPWHFDILYESGREEELMEELFQSLLLKTHPEAIEVFLSNKDVYFLPSVVNMFPHLKDRIEDMMLKRESEKYNL
jgi:hypothetical protein